jgi:hypothetical protein
MSSAATFNFIYWKYFRLVLLFLVTLSSVHSAYSGIYCHINYQKKLNFPNFHRNLLIHDRALNHCIFPKLYHCSNHKLNCHGSRSASFEYQEVDVN